MRSTLFHIPLKIGGIPVLGFGLLFWLWLAVGAIGLAYMLRRRANWADILNHLITVGLVGIVIAVLLPAIAEPEGLPIRGYGVMVLLGILAGIGLATKRAPKMGIDPNSVVALAFWVLIPGIIGARLFYVVQFWPEIRVVDKAGNLDLLATAISAVNIAKGGLVIYGAFVAGIVGLVVFVRKYRLPALRLFDLVAPSFLLGLALGRVGCFLNGCCFGGLCHLPWAVQFPQESPVFAHQIETGQLFTADIKLKQGQNDRLTVTEVAPGSPAEKAGVKPGIKIATINGVTVGNATEARWLLFELQRNGKAVAITTIPDGKLLSWQPSPAPRRTLPVHPTQLYSAINAFVLCLFLLAFAGLKPRDGQVLALLLILYPLTRFILEIIRDDQGPIAYLGPWGLTIAQVISVLLIGAGIALFAYTLLQPRAKAVALEQTDTPKQTRP